MGANVATLNYINKADIHKMRFFSNRDIITIIFAFVFSSLSIYFRESTIIYYIITFIFLIMTIMKGKNYALPLVLFAISNTKSLNIGGISASVLICSIYVLIFLVQGRKIKFSIISLSCLYLIFCSNYFFRFNDYSSAFIFSSKMIIVLWFFYLIGTDKSIVLNRESIAMKSVVFCFVGIVGNLLVSFLIGTGPRASVLGNDPNILSIEASAIFSFLTIMYIRKNRINSVFFFIAMFLLALVIVLAGSRNGYLVFSVSLLVSVICNFKKFSKLAIFIIVTIIAGCIIAFSDLGQSAINTLLTRINNLNIGNNVDNGRFDIWQAYISAFNENSSNWLLGFGNFSNANLTEQAHNFLLEDICTNGILGLIIVVSIEVLIIKKHFKCAKIRRISLYYLLPTFILIIGGITLHGLTNIINLGLMFTNLLFICESKNNKID